MHRMGVTSITFDGRSAWMEALLETGESRSSEHVLEHYLVCPPDEAAAKRHCHAFEEEFHWPTSAADSVPTLDGFASQTCCLQQSIYRIPAGVSTLTGPPQVSP